MGTQYDGYISRYANRRISEPLARLIAKTKITPNQMTLASFGIALLSFISFTLGQNIIGGLLAQLSSIVDGVDGGLARLKGMTSDFGGFLDAVLDRYADVLILLGLTIWSINNETYPGIWLAGFLAVTGSVTISYTRARMDAEHRSLFDRGLQSIASRDVRLFLIMLGGIVGQAYFFLVTVAILTNLVVLYRLFLAHKQLRY